MAITSDDTRNAARPMGPPSPPSYMCGWEASSETRVPQRSRRDSLQTVSEPTRRLSDRIGTVDRQLRLPAMGRSRSRYGHTLEQTLRLPAERARLPARAVRGPLDQVGRAIELPPDRRRNDIGRARRSTHGRING